MYWIKTKDGLTVNYEGVSGFRGFATLKEIEAKAKKEGSTLKELLNIAPIFAWVKTTKGEVKKGSPAVANFEMFATEKEVEEAGGDVSQAEILTTLNPKSDGKNKNAK